MKILFYADTVFGVGGVQRVLAQVAQHLSLRHEVTILMIMMPPMCALSPLLIPTAMAGSICAARLSACATSGG